jgi:hypothetical protein
LVEKSGFQHLHPGDLSINKVDTARCSEKQSKAFVSQRFEHIK